MSYRTIHHLFTVQIRRATPWALMLLLAVAVPGASSAAEQSETSADEPKSASGENRGKATESASEARKRTDDNKPAKTAKSDPSDEIFRPSEEISEDFAVSFPVDI